MCESTTTFAIIAVMVQQLWHIFLFLIFPFSVLILFFTGCYRTRVWKVQFGTAKITMNSRSTPLYSV